MSTSGSNATRSRDATYATYARGYASRTCKYATVAYNHSTLFSNIIFMGRPAKVRDEEIEEDVVTTAEVVKPHDGRQYRVFTKRSEIYTQVNSIEEAGIEANKIGGFYRMV